MSKHNIPLGTKVSSEYEQLKSHVQFIIQIVKHTIDIIGENSYIEGFPKLTNEEIAKEVLERINND